MGARIVPQFLEMSNHLHFFSLPPLPPSLSSFRPSPRPTVPRLRMKQMLRCPGECERKNRRDPLGLSAPHILWKGLDRSSSLRCGQLSLQPEELSFSLSNVLVSKMPQDIHELVLTVFPTLAFRALKQCLSRGIKPNGTKPHSPITSLAPAL